MRWYSQGRRQYSSLAKLINCLIVFCTFAIMGFVAIPSYLMSNKGMASAAKGRGSKVQSARVLDLKKKNEQRRIAYRSHRAQPSLLGDTMTVASGNYGKGVKFTGRLDETFNLSTAGFNSRDKIIQAKPVYAKRGGNYNRVRPLFINKNRKTPGNEGREKLMQIKQ